MKITKKIFLYAWLVIVGLLVFCGTFTVFRFIYDIFPQLRPFNLYYNYIMGMACWCTTVMTILMYFNPGYESTTYIIAKRRESRAKRKELDKEKRELEREESKTDTNKAAH